MECGAEVGHSDGLGPSMSADAMYRPHRWCKLVLFVPILMIAQLALPFIGPKHLRCAAGGTHDRRLQDIDPHR
jgi:hypothetical protein